MDDDQDGGWVFLLVPAHPGSPGQMAVKRLLLMCCYNVTHIFNNCSYVCVYHCVQPSYTEHTSGNFFSYPPHNHHSSDNVYRREGWNLKK